MAPKRLSGLDAPEVEGMAGAQSVVEGAPAWDVAVVAGASVVVLVASPGNCRAVWGLIEEEPIIEPAVPIVNPPGEISAGIVEAGTLNRSELLPSAVTPMTDVEEGGVSIKPVAMALAPTADAEAPVVLDVKLTNGTTWACATSRAPSHIIIAKVNIRSITLS
jgi:hypothetical protein